MALINTLFQQAKSTAKTDRVVFCWFLFLLLQLKNTFKTTFNRRFQL